MYLLTLHPIYVQYMHVRTCIVHSFYVCLFLYMLYVRCLPVHVCAYMVPVQSHVRTANVSTCDCPSHQREIERERERVYLTCKLFHYLIGSIAARHSPNKVSHTYYPSERGLPTGTNWSPTVTNGPTKTGTMLIRGC